MRFSFLIVFLSACGPSPGTPGVSPPDCGVAPVVFDPFGDVIQATNDDGACARIERRDAREPDVICKACPYDPLRLTAGNREFFVDVSDPNALTYTPSHHNWADEMSAVSDDVTAKVTIVYGVALDDWRVELTFNESEPIELIPQGLN
jgi:hypothetical protein